MTPIADRLAGSVRGFFREHALRFGLDPATLDVRYVLNWGGFVNHSFRVSDGTRALHVKIATQPDARAGLERWHERRDSLVRHRAPRILDRFELDGALGLVFPVAGGTSPSCSESVVRAVLESLRGLWADGALAASLQRPVGRTAADCYLETYDDRFVEDLRGIAAAAPPFLSPAALDFMHFEAEALRTAVEDDASFGEPVETPIHGDLWLNNVLWESPASFHIVDWDDLQLGDPAMDVAMLTGPSREDLTPLKHVDIAKAVLDAGAAGRLPTLGRASLLDWVIDPLADWVEADAIGADERPAVRREKERIHRDALALYRRVYAQ